MKWPALLLFFTGIMTSCASTPETPPDLSAYTPIRDDELAARFAPALLPSREHGDPVALLYRASRHASGDIHLTYHFVWEYERNPSSGCQPWLSRNLYTGGIGLQGIMFGRGDIELVSLRLNSAGRPYFLAYETADAYDPNAFAVKHLRLSHETEGDDLSPPLVFAVISWNHLFERRDPAQLSAVVQSSLIRLQPVYFTEALWREYEMVKERTGFFSRHRAHEPFEREAVD